jgi:type I restriction enzyme S subunit
MELKPGYKLTDLGAMPAEWRVATLQEVSEKIMVGIASAATHAYRRRGVPLLRNQNIKAGYLDDDDVLYVDEAYEKTYCNKRLRTGDLLTARTGYPGMTCVVPERYTLAQSFTTLITRPKVGVVDSAFLSHFINSAEGQRFFDRNQIGGAQKNVNAGTLRKMPVPVPSIGEQRAIAIAFGDVDALLGAMDRLIAKKRDLKKAAMQQLLTGQTRLPGFSGEWAKTKTAEICKFVAGVKTAGGDAGYVEIGDIDVDLKTYNLSPREKLSVRGAVEVPAGTLLISKVRPTRGAIAVTKSSIHVSSAFCRLKPANGLLFHLACQHAFLAYLGENAIGGTYPTCRDKTVLAYEAMLPCDPAEQVAIAAVLSDMDAEIEALESRRTKTRELRVAMMQDLLTGKTRLLVEGANA